MIEVRKDISLFWQFVLLAIVAELFGFGCRWLFGVLGSFLSSPMWHGWLGILLYCVVWIYAAIAWVVCWICSYACIYGGVLIALLPVLQGASERRRSKKETFKVIVQFQTRKLIRTFEGSRGFGTQELKGFLNAIHAANLANVRNKDIESWVTECFAKNPQLMTMFGLANLSIEYGRTGRLPKFLINQVPCPTH